MNTAQSSRSTQRPFRTALRGGVFLLPLLLCQAAIFHAVRQFASEADTEQAIRLSNRRLFSQARTRAQSAAASYPFNGYALFQLGVADFAAGTSPDFQKRAQESLLQAAPFMPHLPNLLRLLGQTHYHLKEYAESAAALDRYFRLDPKPRTAGDFLHQVRSMAHFRTGRQGAAAVPLTVAASFPKQELELVVPRLLNALVLRQPNSGQALLRATLFAHPNRGLSAQQIQELFAAASAAEGLATLEQILKPALQSKGADPRLAKYLAAGYLKSRQFDKAVRLAETFRSRYPEDADFPLMLGDIESARGRMDAALEYYRQHLRLRPDSPLREELQRKTGGQL